MTASNRLLWIVATLATAALSSAAQENFALRDGDRVVFYGDSITDQRLYTTFAETYVVTRFPKLNVSFIHSGWGGDRVSGGGGGPIDVRIWRDVLPYNPTVVTIMLGMNDGRYRAFEQQSFDDFSAGYKHIVDTLKRQVPGIRMTLIQLETPDEMRGRVSAVNALFVGMSNQLGDFRAGTAAALIGAITAVLVGGIGTLLNVLLCIKIFPELHQVEGFHATRKRE